MPFSICIAGFTAMIAQTAFLREILATFRGGELTIGTALFSWLLWTAIGSGPFSRRFVRTSQPDMMFHHLLPWFGVLAFIGVMIIRNVPFFTGLATGESVPYDYQFIAVLLAFAPCNLIGGILFVLAAHSLGISKRTSVGTAYTWEAIGSVLAGIAVSLLVISLLSNTGIALLCPALGLLTGSLWFIRNRKFRYLAHEAVPLLILLTALFFSFQLKQYQYEGQTLLTETDTKYGRLRITRNQEQITCYADADVAFSIPDRENAEYAVHIPMLLAPPPKRVLVLGGSPSGIVEELVKYQSVTKIACVELDPALFDLTERFLDIPWDAYNRVETIASDGRAWLSRTEEQFDVIILSMPAPLSGAANRYYTKEFFKRAADKLSSDGVIGFSLLGNENYISEDLAFFLASIRSTVRQVFPAVVALPGVRCRFIAGKQPDMFSSLSWKTLEATRTARAIETVFVRDYYLSTVFSPFRIESLSAALDDIQSPAVNRDTKPSGYVHRTILQGRLDGSKIISAIDSFLSPVVLWFCMALFAGIAAITAFFPGRTVKKPVSAAVVSVGLTEISLEVLAIMAYQFIFGYLYGRIALLTGSYMGGLALGGWFGTRTVEKNRAGMRQLAVVQTGISLLPVCWIILLSFHETAPKQIPFLEVLFFLLTAFAGIAGGFQLPVADNIYRGTTFSGSYSAGRIYSLDLAGSSVGTLITASLMVPVLGMIPVLMFLAALNAATASALWLNRNKT